MDSVVSKRAFLGQTLQPTAWRGRAKADFFYVMSCLTPAFMGLEVHQSQPRLILTCPFFSWETLKFTLLLQGVLSYQGDVETFGRASKWKAADVWLATFHTIIFISFAIFPFVGLADWPLTVPACQLTAAGLAIYCKKRGVGALLSNNEDDFFWHHSMWHYFIFMGAGFSLYLI